MKYQIARRVVQAFGDRGVRLGNREVWDAYVIGGTEGAIVADKHYFDDPRIAEGWAQETIESINSRSPKDEIVV